MANETFLLKTAPQFDVLKWSDYPEVTRVVDAIFGEIKTLRASRSERIREADKVKKHLRVVLIDLWAASKLSLNPYRSISKNKTDYQRESRYRKIHLKYDYLIKVINDLVRLGYIKEKLGYRFGDDSKRTRIKATDKLIDKILSQEYGINAIVESQGQIALIGTDGESEKIILRDADENAVEYEDTASTNLMRENLRKINRKLSSSRIVLKINDTQHAELVARINGDKDPERRTIDFTNNQLHRIFNNSSWEQGGRFYGGWWQNIPKEYRKYIDINHKPTVELDYSGHHIRILYANENLDPPDEPYDLTEYDREDQKQAVLTMLNASNKEASLRAMARKGIRNAKGLVKALSDRHSQIQHHFFTGIGLNLMYQDSIIAEQVMLRMLERGAVVLPVHDSFIVRNSYDRELEEIMVAVFQEQYDRTAQLKYKKTMLEERQEIRVQEGRSSGFVTDDLEEILSDRDRNYRWYRSMWGGL